MQNLAKTPRWAKCLAISLLAGMIAGILTIAVASFFFYRHYTGEFPADTQNVLSALTSSVVVGAGVGAFASIATALIYFLAGLIKPRP